MATVHRPESERLPAAFGDKALVTISRHFNRDIVAVLTTSGRIDEDRLGRAASLLLDAEPVLGCRFVIDPVRPYWERAPGLDEADLCRVVEVEELEAPTISFGLEPLAEDRGPRVRLRILRAARGDRLCVKIDHTAADAGGLKEYLELLCATYRRLRDERGYLPPARRDPAGRSARQVLDRFGPADRLRMLAAAARSRARWVRPPYSDAIALSGTRPVYRIERLPPPRGGTIKRFGEARGATVNDVVVAALLRAIQRIGRPEPGTPVRLLTTADLRRYLPGRRAEGLTNISGFVYVVVGADLGPDLDATTRIVQSFMADQKRSFVGLADYPFVVGSSRLLPFALWRGMLRSYLDRATRAGLGTVGLTNMGAIAPERVDLGGPEVVDAFLAPPVTRPPHVAFGLTGYRGSLTISVGYCEAEPSPSPVGALFDAWLEELPGPE